MQSLIPAIYPILKQNFQLDFTQVGLITFVLQLTGALLQPIRRVLFGSRIPGRTRSPWAWGSRCSACSCLSRAGSFADGARRDVACWPRLVGLPSRVVAHGARGVGRTPRFRAVVLPGRRQLRIGARSAARRLHRAARTGSRASRGSPLPRLVAMAFLVRVGSWVQGAARCTPPGAHHPCVTTRYRRDEVGHRDR